MISEKNRLQVWQKLRQISCYSENLFICKLKHFLTPEKLCTNLFAFSLILAETVATSCLYTTITKRFRVGLPNGLAIRFKGGFSVLRDQQKTFPSNLKRHTETENVTRNAAAFETIRIIQQSIFRKNRTTTNFETSIKKS